MQIIPYFSLNLFVYLSSQNLEVPLVQLQLLRMQTTFNLQPKKRKSFWDRPYLEKQT